MTPQSWRRIIVAVLIAGAAARASVVSWTDPWGPHHPDEHILPLEAIALWEGVTPREVGWPASTSLLTLSAVEAGEAAVATHDRLWQLHSQPADALAVVTEWIGRQFVDPTGLYKTGRAVSLLVGLLQLIVLVWALRQWTGLSGTAIGVFGIALAPLPVLYSQYVLADMMGLLFATALVGLAARPTERRLSAMAALVGLAAGSKFHFGLWLLTPLVIAASLPSTRTRRIGLALAIVGVTAWVVLTLVPWFWINPLLALKEFLGVVAVKMSSAYGGPLYQRVPRNIVALYNSIGVLLFVGFFAGLWLARSEWRRLLPVALPPLFGFLILMVSSVIFDRYGLVLLPGVAIVAALGWERWLSAGNLVGRRVAATAVTICVVLTFVSLWKAERVAGEVDLDVLVKRWVLEHVPAGKHVAVHDEMNAFLPRTAEQLRACAEFLQTPEAYQKKWAIEGLSADRTGAEPMRSMVLNDEQFDAYWCRRELAASHTPGFVVIRYHDEPRFSAVPERDALREFADGGHAITGGVDVLVMNRNVDVGKPPAVVFETARGRRVIYER